jgi:glutathione S-transferase
MEPPRLVTIPISHFCEKARWGLERAGIEYREERHLQGFHVWYARRAGGGYTVPVLVLPDGRVIAQSSGILQWIDTQVENGAKLYPAEIAPRVMAVERWLDLTLGPDGRAWMYSFMLHQKGLANAYGTEGTTAFERRVFSTMFDALKPAIRARVGIGGASTDIARVRDVFDEIAARLSDGRSYLFGNSFTAADLTFAALSAAVLMPDNYGVALPRPDVLPREMSDQIEALRAHPAGRFALRMFATERARYRRVTGSDL